MQCTKIVSYRYFPSIGGAYMHRLRGYYLIPTTPYLGSFSSDSSCQLNVLRHDRHALRMNSAKVGVFE